MALRKGRTSSAGRKRRPSKREIKDDEILDCIIVRSISPTDPVQVCSAQLPDRSMEKLPLAPQKRDANHTARPQGTLKWGISSKISERITYHPESPRPSRKSQNRVTKPSSPPQSPTYNAKLEPHTPLPASLTVQNTLQNRWASPISPSSLGSSPEVNFNRLTDSAEAICDEERLTRRQKKEIYKVFEQVVEPRQAERFPDEFPESRVREEETAGPVILTPPRESNIFTAACSLGSSPTGAPNLSEGEQHTRSYLHSERDERISQVFALMQLSGLSAEQISKEVQDGIANGIL